MVVWLISHNAILEQWPIFVKQFVPLQGDWPSIRQLLSGWLRLTAWHIILIDDKSRRLLQPPNEATQRHRDDLGGADTWNSQWLEGYWIEPTRQFAAGPECFAEPLAGYGAGDILEYSLFHCDYRSLAAPGQDANYYTGSATGSRPLPGWAGVALRPFDRLPQRLACHWVTIYVGRPIFNMGAKSAVCTLVFQIKEFLWQIQM